MKTMALLTIQANDQGVVRWNTPFSKTTLPERMLQTIAHCPVIDGVVVASDCPELLESGELGGVDVGAFPENMRAYQFNYLGVTLARISMETTFYKSVGIEADIVFHLDWRLALLTARSLERMFHTLLDSPTLPARVMPVSEEDPGLFMQIDGGRGFFPVWHAAGVDRQCIPQLYRPASACVSFLNRLGHGIPFVKGLKLQSDELLSCDTPYRLELGAYLLRRKESA